MRISFTGTQNGLTKPQRASLRKLLQEFDATEYHHGDCIGADSEFHYMVAPSFVVKHPAIVDSSKRAFCKGGITLTPQPPLARNKDIVDEGKDLLIACPSGIEVLRSGTWSTVRYARKRKVPIRIVWPDGRITDGAQEDVD